MRLRKRRRSVVTRDAVYTAYKVDGKCVPPAHTGMMVAAADRIVADLKAAGKLGHAGVAVGTAPDTGTRRLLEALVLPHKCGGCGSMQTSVAHYTRPRWFAHGSAGNRNANDFYLCMGCGTLLLNGMTALWARATAHLTDREKVAPETKVD